MEFYEKRDNKDEVEERQCTETSEIQEFYANKTIFITGASGFLGTLVLEKLVRSCKDIRKIYVLFRSTNKKHVKDRIKEYFDNPVFDRMKFENPRYASQVTCVEGDMSLDNLGLSSEDAQAIIDNTQVIMHVAATVKFDEHLMDAYNINVKGCKTVIRLAEQMKQLQTFVYVSTAYCNCNWSHIEEKFYDPPFTDEETVRIIQYSEPYEQALLTPFILENKPNTYIFTKAICEDLVRQSSNRLPVVVVRPSVVMPTLKEPFPYWTTRGNSLLGLMAGNGLGLIRVFYNGRTKKIDLTPGDLTANLVLAAGWHRATSPKSPLVYNCVGGESSISTALITHETSRYHKEAKEAVDKVVWQSHLIEVENIYLLFFLYYVLHVLPGLFFSLVERYTNRKPMIMKIYRKFFFLNKIIRYFSFNEWTFSNDNTKTLLHRLNARDRKLFDIDMETVSWLNFSTVLYRCVSKYILEDYTMYPKEVYRKKMKFIDPIDTVIVWGFHIGAAYFALSIFSACLSYVFNYF